MNNSKYYQVKNLYPSLKNPQKYIAENKVITTRSSWETSFISTFLDKHPSVISWTSEDTIVLYQCPTRNYSTHRYFVDFLFKVEEANGTKKEYLAEVKPYQEMFPPKLPKKKTKSYLDRVNTYIKNEAKWKAAREYCKQLRLLGRNVEFIIVSENGILFEDGRFEKVKLFV